MVQRGAKNEAHYRKAEFAYKQYLKVCPEIGDKGEFASQIMNIASARNRY